MKEEGQIYKTLPQISKFASGLSYDLSKFSDGFFPCFRLWKTITKSLGKKTKNSEATFCSHKHDEQVCQVS